jgi:hypothetical protein
MGATGYASPAVLIETSWAIAHNDDSTVHLGEEMPRSGRAPG